MKKKNESTGRIEPIVMPPLPQEISSDGREIWDWAARLSNRSMLLHKRRELSKQIADIKIRCGSCTKWMIPYCPKEKHDNKKGHSVGPNMNTNICGQFDMKHSSIDLIERWSKELSEVNGKLERA